MTLNIKSFIQGLLIAALLLSLAACDAFDPYGEKFNAISIGKSRTEVIAALGEPDSVANIDWPLVKIEQLAWHSRINGRVYTVITVLDRVAGKTVIQ